MERTIKSDLSAEGTDCTCRHRTSTDQPFWPCLRMHLRTRFRGKIWMSAFGLTIKFFDANVVAGDKNSTNNF
jgi:hypothetical protein